MGKLKKTNIGMGFFNSLGTSAIALGFIFFLTSCSTNLLEEFGSKDTDEAKIIEIKKQMDDKDYDGALASFNELDTDLQAVRGNQVILAQIYAGQCGLDFVALSEELTDLGSNTFLTVFMTHFSGAATTAYTACESAQDVILGIEPDATLRTITENLTLVYISWTKMGVILSSRADADNNGTPDAGFDACDSTDLPQVEAQHIATALSHMSSSLTAIGGGVAGEEAGTQLATLCSALGNPPFSTYDFCSVADEADVTADMEKGVRSVVKESQDFGIGANCTGDLTTCNCP